MNRIALARIADRLLLMFLPCLIFSYLPVISLGKAAGMSIEISLLYLMTVGVFLAGVLSTRKLKLLYTPHYTWLLLCAYFVFTTLSILWTANVLRGLITAGFLGLLIGVMTITIKRIDFLKRQKTLIEKMLFIGLGIVFVWSVWQITADAFFLSTVFAGLPSMYSGDVFGIARPTGFSLEPQFLGSLLIIPTVWSLYKLIKEPWKRASIAMFCISWSLILMTVSRGALLGVALGSLLLLVIVRPAIKKVVTLFGLFVVVVILYFAIVFTIGSIRQDGISGSNAVNRVVNQLTFGIVTIPETPLRSHSSTQQSTPTFDPTTPVETQPSQKPATNGYISESTNSRTSMTMRALQLWHSTPKTTVFGVGIGGFGARLHTEDNRFPISSVVNNYFVELLVETGLIGAVLFAGSIITLLVSLIRARAFLAFSILSSLLVQMTFFSGNANIIHIWVVIGLCIGITMQVRKSAVSSSRLVQ